MTTLRAAAPGWGRALKLSAAVGLALGVAHCSIDLGYLNEEENSGGGDPFKQAPPWSPGGPVAGQPGYAGAGGAPDGAAGTSTGTGMGASGGAAGEPGAKFELEPYSHTTATNDRWCAERPPATFCADFEGGAALGDMFYPIEGAPPPSITTRASKSGKHSLFIEALAAAQGSGPFSTKVVRPFLEPNVRGFTLELQFRPELVSDSPILISAVEFGAPNDADFYSLRLAFASQALHLEEHRAGSDTLLATLPITITGWTHLWLSVDLGGGAPLARFRTIDDATGLESTVGGPDIALAPPARLPQKQALLLGIVYGTRPHTGWNLEFDNVALNLR